MTKIQEYSPTIIFRHSLRLFFSIFMVTGAVISGLIMIFYQSEIKTRLSQLKSNEIFAVSQQSEATGNIFDSIVTDLFFLTQQNELLEYLENRDPAKLNEIAVEYLNMSAQKKTYDQIRFLDAKGMELVRINYNQGTPSPVPTDQLQSKQKRYYFKDCFELTRGEVFISPFDLNIERGQIERPLKPMIRIGAPVFDADGKKQGIVLFNYLGSDLLQKIRDLEQISPGQSMLLNRNGYWLLSPNASQEWGFMFKKEQHSFSFLYPDTWKQIREQNNGQILTSDGLFTYQTIFPLMKNISSSSGTGEAYGQSNEKISSQEYYWHHVSFVSNETLQSFSHYLLPKLFIFGAGIFLIIASGSWFLALAITKRRIYRNQLQSMALYDSLTELPNRRLFYDKLKTTIERCKRYKDRFGLLYLDLDGFKKINDSLGHEAGDALLCEVSKILLKCTRKSDTVARLGGDEFALIIDFLKTNDGAEVTAKKIIASLSQPIALPQGEVHVGASVGISLFPVNSRDSEELVRQADAAMYHSKRKGKNTYSLFHPEITSEVTRSS